MTNINNDREEYCGEKLLKQANLICEGQIKATLSTTNKLISDLIETAQNPECYGPNLMHHALILAENQKVNLDELLLGEFEQIKKEVQAITSIKMDNVLSDEEIEGLKTYSAGVLEKGNIREIERLEIAIKKILDNSKENNPNSGNPKLIELLEKVKFVKINESNKKIKKGEKKENTQEGIETQDKKQAKAA